MTGSVIRYKPYNPTLLILLCVIVLYTQRVGAQIEKIDFWEMQQKGVNHFNAVPTIQWLESVDNANIKLVRLTFAKWEGEQKDFLLGDADNFQGIVKADFQKLLKFLNSSDSLGIKVVITPISLPGARWIQNNQGKPDGRLWKEIKFQKQAALYWKELANRLKNHPAIVGYNIKNEPHPENFHGKESFWNRDLKEWYLSIKGSPADLNLFYTHVISAIREVDRETPIIIESGMYATAWAFDYLKKVNDPKIIYSFHMYEPYNYTTSRINNDQYQYPGKVTIDKKGTLFEMNKLSMKEFLNPVKDWARNNNIPANRIWVGEFGCSRKVNGVENYLSDLVEIFNEYNWHWALYSYREDVWDNMDYELGTQKVNWKYWEYSEKKTLHLHYNEIYGNVKSNTIWPIFEKEFK